MHVRVEGTRGQQTPWKQMSRSFCTCSWGLVKWLELGLAWNTLLPSSEITLMDGHSAYLFTSFSSSLGKEVLPLNSTWGLASSSLGCEGPQAAQQE